MAILSVRRYFLRKSQELDLVYEPALAAAYRAKQRAAEGSPLPPAFPFRAELARAQYTTKEDLTGATADELLRFAELPLAKARAVLVALAALL